MIEGIGSPVPDRSETATSFGQPRFAALVIMNSQSKP
jgi:hypothetical protein